MNRRTRQSDIEIRDAEIERLRSENEQLSELSRMEREALIGASKEVERILRARIAELEAAARPIPFSEREPEEGESIFAWDGSYWHSTDWDGDVKDAVRADCTHWLPWPPAPEGDV